MDPVSKQVLEKLYAGDRAGADEAAAAGDLDVFAAAAIGADDRLLTILAEDPEAATARADDGFTALHLAAFFGTPATVAALLAAGADPASVAGNASCVTPLHSALAHRDRDITALLLEAGAPVNAQQAGGYTALHSAAMHGDVGLVRLLIEHGADTALADDRGDTAADYARKGGHAEIAEELEGTAG